MDTNNPGSVQYNRWDENNINIDVERSQPTSTRWDIIMSYKRKIQFLILRKIYPILQKSNNSLWAEKYTIVYPERVVVFCFSFLQKNTVRPCKKNNKKQHSALITLLLHSQDLQQNVHWSDWNCSEDCWSFVCTGGHLHHWIRDRILCPPMLTQVLSSFIIISTCKLTAA